MIHPPYSLRDVAMTAAQPAQMATGDRWILVDDFQSDGRRYLVAKLVGPSVPLPFGSFVLSARNLLMWARRAKGESIKAIAIDVNLSPSTVSSLIGVVSKGLVTHERKSSPPAQVCAAS